MIKRCWICNNKVEQISKEHRIKRSDLNSEFTGTQPLYISTDKKINRKIQGSNSNELKYSAPMCAYCNNTRTQPHDRAWEKLSKFLNSIKPVIQAGDKINLGEIFPGSVHKSMLNVHLYFVKQFGCKIREADIPIGLSTFSDAILNNRQHDEIFIAICPKLTDSKLPAFIGHTDLHADHLYIGNIVFAVWAAWYYELINFSIRIMFAKQKQNQEEHREELKNSWRPSTIHKNYIKIAKCKNAN